MNRVTDRIVCLWAIYCLMAVVAGTSALKMARGQEVLPPPLPTRGAGRPNQALIADAGPGRAPTIVIVTGASNVPLVGHFFQSGQGPTFCEEVLQNVGADSDHDCADGLLGGRINIHVFGDLPHCNLANNNLANHHPPLRLGFVGPIIDNRDVRTGEHRARASLLTQHVEQETAACLGSLPCPGCAAVAAGACTCASETKCGSDCAAAHCSGCNCDECQSAKHVAQSNEARCGDDCCALARLVLHTDEEEEEDGDEIADFHPLKLMQHIAGLMAERAAAQAALEARDQSDEKLSELIDTITELAADNAALDAKLQAQAEQAKLHDKITELVAENSRLKAHVELAAERTEFLKGALALTLENERLKLRLADLEQKQAAADAARTASESHGERKPR